MSQPLAQLLSIVVEVAVAAGLVMLCGWGSARRVALVAAICTLASHPFAWWAIQHLAGPMGYALAVLVIEAAVVLAETVVYRWAVPLPGWRALAVAFVANLVSTAVGLAIYALRLA
jgi:hypothetical protein